MNEWEVVKDFEQAIAEYTGAPYVVCVNSCTNALLLSLMWRRHNMKRNSYVYCPKKTYISVPMVITRAGFKIKWDVDDWQNADKHSDIGLGPTSPEWVSVYCLYPSNIIDSARKFTSGMYQRGHYWCVSFAASKILGMEQGGAILHDNEKADKWFRRMRFDGRTEGVDPKDDTFDLIGHHCPMLPSVAAQGILRLHHLPKHNEDLPHYDYPDLSQHPAFK